VDVEMNPKYFGDSYDIVKRFFCGVLSDLGYEVFVDSKFTGDWSGKEADFHRLIGASPVVAGESPAENASVLFLDPDTGVRVRSGRQHVSFSRLAQEANHYDIVFAFDQSFSRNNDARSTMTEKMEMMRSLGCHAMYYNSHARFLFVSREAERLDRLRDHLRGIGLPHLRLLMLSDLSPASGFPALLQEGASIHGVQDGGA
jgi:hypothetical protein